jgi:hypothetical protein
MARRLVLFALAWLAGLRSSDSAIAESDWPAANLMWSARPLSEASIHSDGVWEDMADSNVTVHLEREAEVLASYALTATGFRRQATAPLGANDFFSSSIALSGVGQRNFLQLRISVNGVPYRQSSAHLSPGLSFEANTDSLSGHLAVTLPAGAHDVRLQWKKVGPGVSLWTSRPTLADGFTSGRSLVVTARHKHLWHTHGEAAAHLDAEGAWEDVGGTALNFTLDAASTLRLLYSMTVRSDTVDFEKGKTCARLSPEQAPSPLCP